MPVKRAFPRFERRNIMAYSGLLGWYDTHRRSFAFRGIKDPYAVWVSEIMLQQTRTETAEGYFIRFMERFPTVKALADAPEQEVLKYWEGLGYYTRARNLHKAAKLVRDEYNGVFPKGYEAVRALPGIGDYTAAAVCSIAYGYPKAAVDGNLRRVLCRAENIREDMDRPDAMRRLQEMADDLIDRDRPGDWNQALMDIGATICLPGTPECALCPLAPHCRAKDQSPEALPVHSKLKPPVSVPVGVGLVFCGDTVLLCKRKEKLLQNLWVFALCEGDNTPEAVQKTIEKMGLRVRYTGKAGEARHVFTHRVWQMKLCCFEAEETIKKPDRVFVTAEGLEALPMPTAMRAARNVCLSIMQDQQREQRQDGEKAEIEG